jgi:hypothetical protein
MFSFLRVGGAAAIAIAFAGFAPSTIAQESTSVQTCQPVWSSAPEPLGDREGHAILVSQGSCRIESGPLSGGVLTDVSIWEFDGAKAVRLTESGIIRKSDAVVVINGTGGNFALTMADGKVTGWTASGRDNYLMATGSAAPLAGKSFTWTAKPTGPAGQLTVEAKDE